MAVHSPLGLRPRWCPWSAPEGLVPHGRPKQTNKQNVILAIFESSVCPSEHYLLHEQCCYHASIWNLKCRYRNVYPGVINLGSTRWCMSWCRMTMTMFFFSFSLSLFVLFCSMRPQYKMRLAKEYSPRMQPNSIKSEFPRVFPSISHQWPKLALGLEIFQYLKIKVIPARQPHKNKTNKH